MSEKFHGSKPHTYPEEALKGRTEERHGQKDSRNIQDLLRAAGENASSQFQNILEKHEHADMVHTIEELNEGTLKDIFLERVARAGREVSDLNFVPLKKIKFVPDDGSHAYGMYDPIKHGIALCPDVYTEGTSQLLARLAEGGRKFGISPEHLLKLQTIYTLIHEETHAISFSGLRVTRQALMPKGNSKQELNEEGQLTIRRESTASGYHRFDDHFYADADGNIDTQVSDYYRAVNEGVTELIALKVMEEYARRIGIQNIPTTTVREYIALMGYKEGSSYSRNVRAIQMFSEVIAQATDIPSDVVIDAIMRGYLRGRSFIDNDMEELLTEALGEKIGWYLNEFAKQSDMPRFLKALEVSDIKLSGASLKKLNDKFFGSPHTATT